MNKKKQLVLALTLGYPNHHELVTQALADNQNPSELMEKVDVTKEDLLHKTTTGKSFFEYADTWKNITKLKDVLPDLKGADFFAEYEEGKTLADLAAKLGQERAVFEPVFWKGQLKAFEKAWGAADFKKSYPEYMRKRRDVAEISNDVIREDDLAEKGVATKDLAEALKSGDYEEIRAKLAEHNDHLRAEDILLLNDEDGKPVFQFREAWNNIEKFWEELAQNGETLAKDDFFTGVNGSNSLMAMCVEHYDLPEKIFNKKVWQGRSDLMMDAYKQASMVSEKSMFRLRKFDIAEVLADVVDDELSGAINLKGSLEKTDLTSVVKGPFTDVEGNDIYFTALDLPSTWESIEKALKKLEKAGTPLTLDDLRTVSGPRKEPFLMTAARAGKFDVVMDLVKKDAGQLTAEDLTTVYNDKKESLLDILIDSDQDMTLLDPELWVGREEDLCRFWDEYPRQKSSDIDFDALRGEVSVLTLRQAFNKAQNPANDNTSESKAQGPKKQGPGQQGPKAAGL